MTRPELTYCACCGGVILPVDTAVERDGNWECAICNEPCADSLCDGEDELDDELADAVAFERGTFRMAADWRDELDGGQP